jgi:hypothetical protein
MTGIPRLIFTAAIVTAWFCGIAFAANFPSLLVYGAAVSGTVMAALMIAEEWT